jgi:hypothetical protein
MTTRAIFHSVDNLSQTVNNPFIRRVDPTRRVIVRDLALRMGAKSRTIIRFAGSGLLTGQLTPA